jgi:hypothetical protein
MKQFTEGLEFVIPYHETWDIIDATKVTEYMTCPRKYFYKYILGWNYESSYHLTFGSAWHKALAHLYANQNAWNTVRDYTEILSIFINGGKNGDEAAYNLLQSDDGVIGMALEEFEKHFADRGVLYSQDFFPKTVERAALALLKYAMKYQDDIYTTIKLDEELGVEICGKVMLGDYIYTLVLDVLSQNQEGKIFVMDHKSGSSSYNWQSSWDLSFQMNGYAFACMSMFGPKETGGVVVNGTIFGKTKNVAKTDSLEPFRHIELLRAPLMADEQTMNVWYTTALKYLDDIKADFALMAIEGDGYEVQNSFAMRPINCNYHYGKPCMYKDFCTCWSNPLRKAVELDGVPVGFERVYWDPTEDKRLNIDIN